MKLRNRTYSHLSLALAISTPAVLCAQGMPPTPLLNGASVQFIDLANPDTSAEKLAIYAKYYESATYGIAATPSAISPTLISGGGSNLVRVLLLGEDLVPSSKILSTTTLTEAQVLAAGVSQADIDNIHADAVGVIRYYQYRYVNDISPAAIPAQYRSTASVNITVLPALGADHGVVTIQDTLGYKRYFSVPLSAGNPATVTVSGMEAGVATFNTRLLVSGAAVANGFKRYALPKNEIRNIAFPETGPSQAYPLAQITRMLLTQANQNDDGSAVVIAGRPAMLQTYLWDPQGRAGLAQTSLRANLPGGGSQPILSGFNGSPVFASDDRSTYSVVLPPELVQPGITFTLDARLSDGTVLSRTFIPNIQLGRRLILHVYEVSPGPEFSGVPVARDSAGFQDQLAKWAADQLPVAGIDVDIRPGMFWPPSNPGTPWSDPGYTMWDLANLAAQMDTFAAAEGHPRTDGNIYVAMINGRYAQTGYWGITAGKGFPGIALFMFDQENTRHNLTHELGHTHWLGHSPSPGATSDPNPVDWDYPYGGDSVISFTPWSPLKNGGLMPTTNKDLMSYYYPSSQWISDFNWSRFFDRTQDSGLPFLATPTPSYPTTLLPKMKPGVPFVIGPKEAQALADYLDANEPMACGGLTADALTAARAKACQEAASPIPDTKGAPPVIVQKLIRPKKEIHTFQFDHVPTELEQFLAIPQVFKGKH